MTDPLLCQTCGQPLAPDETTNLTTGHCPRCAPPESAHDPSRVRWFNQSRNPRVPLDTPEPGIYPATHRPDGAEGEVWQALGAKRPPGWYVWHHVVAGRGVHQAEIDFVVAVPGKGIVLLECKGGAMTRRDGRWYQNGHLMFEQPGEQLERARRAFVKDLRNRARRLPEIAIALCFPATSAPTNRDLGGVPVLYREDMQWFEFGGAAQLLKAFSGSAYANDETYVAALHGMWGPDWWPVRPLSRLPDRAEVAWRQLTSEQSVLLSCLDESRRILVEGPPGSGKSLALMALANQFQAAKQRTLVFTYTRAIAAEMARAGLLAAYPIRDWALVHALKAGLVTVSQEEVEAHWRAPEWLAMLREVALHLESHPLTWDVVMIDEAQDLGQEDWEIVDRLMGPRTRLWLFGDENQRALWHARAVEIPARLTWTASFKLRAGLRSPPELLDLASRILEGDASVFDPSSLSAIASAFELIVLPEGGDADARRAALTDAVNALLAQEGVMSDDVAIISLGALKTYRERDVESLSGRPLRRADEAPTDGAIVCDTVMRMKGLERPFVVVTDLDLARFGRPRLMYLALTRASAKCVVVATAAEIEALAERG